MKIKIFSIFFVIFFSIIFLMFYKGLENSNIYEPKVNLEKNIPVFVAKMFSTNKKINSEKIFAGDKFYLMNIWASWCAPCRKEHIYLINLSRQKNIEMFQDPKSDSRFFVGNPQTGGYGITLTAANNVIYYSNGYDLEKRQQSEARIDRIGQERPMTYIDIICENTGMCKC